MLGPVTCSQAHLLCSPIQKYAMLFHKQNWLAHVKQDLLSVGSAQVCAYKSAWRTVLRALHVSLQITKTHTLGEATHGLQTTQLYRDIMAMQVNSLKI